MALTDKQKNNLTDLRKDIGNNESLISYYSLLRSGTYADNAEKELLSEIAAIQNKLEILRDDTDNATEKIEYSKARIAELKISEGILLSRKPTEEEKIMGLLAGLKKSSPEKYLALLESFQS